MVRLGTNFWLFRYSQIMVKMGYYASAFAVVWWVLDKYHTASSVTFVVALPMFCGVVLKVFLSPLGDIYSKKKIIITGTLIELLSCLGVTSLLYCDFLDLNSLLGLELLASFGAALNSVGSIGILPSLVSREKILVATKVITGVDSFVALTSASVGGVLLTSFGVLYSFVFYTTMITVSFLFIMPLKITGDLSENPPLHSVKRIMDDFISGVVFTVNNKVTRILFFYSLFLGIAFACMQIAIPYIIKMVNNWPASYFGFITSSLAVGVIISSLGANTVSKTIVNSKVILYSTMLFCLSSIILAMNPHVLFFGLAYFFMGVSKNSINIIIDSKLLSSLPEHKRTKVLSNLFFCSNIAMPLSMLISGEGVDFIGPFKILGCIFIIFSVALYLIMNPIMWRFFDGTDAEINQLMSEPLSQEEK